MIAINYICVKIKVAKEKYLYKHIHIHNVLFGAFHLSF